MHLWSERYPNLSNCILISDAKYEWFQEFEGTKHGKRPAKCEEMKAAFREIMLRVLYEKVPQAKGRVLWSELGCPLADAEFLNSYRAGSYGTRCNTSYFSRESARWILKPETEIRGLYLAGQDAFFPSVAGAIYGGSLAAARVLGLPETLRTFGKLVLGMVPSIREKEKVGYCRALQIAYGRIFSP